MSSNPTIAALEQKYIELLERKIAKLESADATKGASAPTLQKKGSATSITAVNGDTPTSSNNGTTATEAASNDGSTNNSRIRFRKRTYNKEGVSQEEDEAVASKPEESKSKNKHAMTVLRCLNSEGKYEYSYITIEDDGLQALLLYALSHHPDFSHSGTMMLFNLFEPLIHNWASLNDLVDTSKNAVAIASLRQSLQIADSMSILAPLQEPGKLEMALSDLKQLLDQVRDTPKLEDYFKGVRDMVQKASTISFEYLWTIFPPGELIYSQTFMERPQVFIVKESSDFIYERRRTREKYWSLECWTYDWDGTSFNRTPVQFEFDHFKGTRSISSLHCYPLRYYRENSDDDTPGKGGYNRDIKTTLIERGKRYRELCIRVRGKQIFRYDGWALSRGTGVRKVTKTKQEDNPDGWSSTTRDATQSQSDRVQAKRQMIKTDRVMIDFSSYLQHGPEYLKYAPMGEVTFVEDDDSPCKCGSCMGNERLKENQKMHYDGVKRTKDDWEDTQYLICPPRVLGYHLKSKRWVELDIQRVTDIENLEDRSSFDSLELGRTQKRLIYELVKYHASGKSDKERAMTDLMQGKGNGLVILLHGPPGVGKTLTAESVANATGKPLFAVSVSDIGLKPSEFEQSLKVLFELATTWGAVMLFDEADVFLESRSSNTANLERNALVSVLLRVLEYYDGILILTTNRIRTFDIAVQSRVNFAITYKNLDENQKKKIYLNFIKQLNEQNTHNHQKLLNWPNEDEWNEDKPFETLNGRQIRNVLFSAVSIAQGQKGDKRLSKDHILQILKETTKFQNEIHSMIEMARKEAEVGIDRG